MARNHPGSIRGRIYWRRPPFIGSGVVGASGGNHILDTNKLRILTTDVKKINLISPVIAPVIAPKPSYFRLVWRTRVRILAKIISSSSPVSAATIPSLVWCEKCLGHSRVTAPSQSVRVCHAARPEGIRAPGTGATQPPGVCTNPRCLYEVERVARWIFLASRHHCQRISDTATASRSGP